MKTRYRLLLLIVSVVLSLALATVVMEQFKPRPNPVVASQPSTLPAWFFVIGRSHTTGDYRLLALRRFSQRLVAASLHGDTNEALEEFSELWPSAEMVTDNEKSGFDYVLPAEAEKLDEIGNQITASLRTQMRFPSVDVVASARDEEGNQEVRLRVRDEGAAYTYIYAADDDSVVVKAASRREGGVARLQSVLVLLLTLVFYATSSVGVRLWKSVADRQGESPDSTYGMDPD